MQPPSIHPARTSYERGPVSFGHPSPEGGRTRFYRACEAATVSSFPRSGNYRGAMTSLTPVGGKGPRDRGLKLKNSFSFYV